MGAPAAGDLGGRADPAAYFQRQHRLIREPLRRPADIRHLGGAHLLHPHDRGPVQAPRKAAAPRTSVPGGWLPRRAGVVHRRRRRHPRRPLHLSNGDHVARVGDHPRRSPGVPALEALEQFAIVWKGPGRATAPPRAGATRVPGSGPPARTRQGRRHGKSEKALRAALRTLLPVLVMAAGACASAAAPVTSPELPIDLAIVTWNMHIGVGDLPRLVDDLTAGRLTPTPPANYLLLLQE